MTGPEADVWSLPLPDLLLPLLVRDCPPSVCLGKRDCDDLAVARAEATPRALGGRGVWFIKASCPEPLPAGVVGDGVRSLGAFNFPDWAVSADLEFSADLCQAQ